MIQYYYVFLGLNTIDQGVVVYVFDLMQLQLHTDKKPTQLTTSSAELQIISR